MKNEVNLGESELFVAEMLSRVAGQITGAELIHLTFGTDEGDEGEYGVIRIFTVGETCVTKSLVYLRLQGKIRVTRDPNKRWKTGVITGSVYVNPDHPTKFRVENGVVTPIER